MQIRHALAMSIGFKVVLLAMCFSLLCAHKAFGNYFNPTLSPNQQRSAVRAAFNVDARNSQGLTGLMFAAINGELALARALFEKGALLNLVSPKEKQTALHYATNNLRVKNSQDVGYYLIDAYANTRLKNKRGDTPLQLIISTDIIADRERMMEALIKNGADINAQNSQGDTLLHLAVNLQAYNWVPTLLEKYASIINRSLKNKKGLTPAQYAKKLGFGDMLKVLNKSYPMVTTASGRDSMGLTGLMLAVMSGNQRRVAALVKDQRAINLLSNDQYQNSALHIALLQQNEKALAALVRNKANRNIKNAQGELPAHFIVRMWDAKKKPKAAALLFANAGKTILAQTNSGDTVLHCIVRYDDKTTLNYLIKNFKPFVQQALAIENNAIETPIQLAARLRRNRIGRMLVKIS